MSTAAQIREVYRMEVRGPFRCGCPRVPRARSTRENRIDAIRRAAVALDVRQFLSQRITTMKRLPMLLAMLLLGVALQAATVSLQWDVHPDTAVTGYVVGWGPSPGNYTSQSAPIVGRLVSAYTVQNLTTGTWYFAVRAMAGATASPYSNEVSRAVSPAAPTTLRITGVTASAQKFRAEVLWATDIPCGGFVRYGEWGALGSTSPMALPALSQRVVITGLKNRRTYSYQVVARAADGTEVLSPVATFTTS